MIGLARDLRGIVFAFNTKISYMMLFDWIYPAYTPILHRAVEIWYQDPQVQSVLQLEKIHVVLDQSLKMLSAHPFCTGLLESGTETLRYSQRYNLKILSIHSKYLVFSYFIVEHLFIVYFRLVDKIMSI